MTDTTVKPAESVSQLWSLFTGHRGRPIHKWTQYFPAYERHFARFIGKAPLMFEIGCGEGGSLQMWKSYFGEGARIVGVDIRPECRAFEEDQIAIRIGDQSDVALLQSLIDEFGVPDIVLDDGSHVMRHVNATFDFLYDRTSRNGVYMVEDLHTAYWPSFGGGLRREGTFIERTKNFIDQINRDYTNEAVKPTPFSDATASMHVYDSLIAFERVPLQRKEALEIGGPHGEVRNTTQILRALSKLPVANGSGTLPVTNSLSGESMHIHLAAMAPTFLDVRTRLPLKELAKAPNIATSISERKIELPRLAVEQPKVLLLQRASIQDPVRWTESVKQMIRAGWVVVAELDDHPELLASVHKRTLTDGAWDFVRLAHAVQTSTSALADAIRLHNPEVAVFRNDAFALPPLRLARGDGVLRVFFGALNREGISARVAAALAPVSSANSEIEFVVVHDKAFFEALGPARKQFSPALSYDAYLEVMAGCDIALMPLEGAPGEIFKSDIKFVEAASRGLAVIASPTVYGASIRHDKTGLIAASPEAFAEALARLQADPALRERLGATARAEIAATRLFDPAPRLTWYRDLWARRQPLTSALLQRFSPV